MRNKVGMVGSLCLLVMLGCSGSANAVVYHNVVNSTEDGVSFAYMGQSGSTVSAYRINSNNNTISQIDCGGGKTCKEKEFLSGRRQKFDQVTIVDDGGFAYVANSESNDISAFRINKTTGNLVPIECREGSDCNGVNFSAGKSPKGINVDPDGKFAYVANWTSDSVSAYSIDASTGMLKRIKCSNGNECKGMDFAAGDFPLSVTIHPTGLFAYVNNYYEDDISAYRINRENGSVTKIECQNEELCKRGNFITGERPNSFVITPSGKFAYVANRGSNDITVFAINTTTGYLTQVACGTETTCVGRNYQAGSGPWEVVIHPEEKFAFVDNYVGNDISVYRIKPDSGALIRIKCESDPDCHDGNFASGEDPNPVTIDPKGRFLYVGNTDSNSISAYTIDSNTGYLKRIECRDESFCSEQDFMTGRVPESVMMDTTGKIAFAYNRSDKDLTVYRMNDLSGSLVQIVCDRENTDKCNGDNFGGDTIRKRLDASYQLYSDGRYAECARGLAWVIARDSEGTYRDSASGLLGYMYEIGLGVERDMKMAEDFYRGSHGSTERLHLLYDYESSDLRSWSNAFARTMKRAKSGDHASEYALGYIYLYGLGVKKDDQIAAEWMKLAAEDKNPYARFLYGVMLKSGIGMRKDEGAARQILQQAADIGSKDALETLQLTVAELPDPYRKEQQAQTPCNTDYIRFQEGFPKQQQITDFEDFRLRLRHDVADAITRPEGLAGIDSETFKASIDSGKKGQAITEEIGRIVGAKGYVPPLWVMLQYIVSTACPVGYGGQMTDETGQEFELWYVAFNPEEDGDERDVFKNYHLPDYGKIERKVYPTMVFVRDKDKKLKWYSFTSEMIELLKYWYSVQFT